VTRPLTIALVGIDGAGKSTQAGLLAEWLTSVGVPARHVKNPGGRLRLDRIARALGRPDAISLLGRGGFLVVEVLVRWVLLIRSVLWSRLTRRVTVMDRYTYCQYAAMRARGNRGERLVRLLYWVFPRPGLVCFLTVAPTRARERIERRGKDREGLDYLVALDAGYRSLPETAGFTVVDANLPTVPVHAALREVVERQLPLAVAVRPSEVP
jgi:dTMP kinase